MDVCVYVCVYVRTHATTMEEKDHQCESVQAEAHGRGVGEEREGGK